MNKESDRVDWFWLHVGTSAIAPLLYATIPDRHRVIEPHEVQLDENSSMGSDWGSHCFSDRAAQQIWH